MPRVRKGLRMYYIFRKKIKIEHLEKTACIDVSIHSSAWIKLKVGTMLPLFLLI